MNKFPLRIRELRLEREMTQEDVGNIVGKAKSAISNWEQGIREPDNETLMILAEYFSVTIDWLLGRSDYRQGRIVTNGELLSFLPADVVERNKIEIWVDEAELSEKTKEEIRQVLKQNGYL